MLRKRFRTTVRQACPGSTWKVIGPGFLLPPFEAAGRVPSGE